VKTVKGLLLLGSVVLLAVLVYHVGTEPVLTVLARLTWWQFALALLPSGAAGVCDTLGWRFAFTRNRTPFRRLYGARLAGEAMNVVTALGPVGGEPIKAWLVRRHVAYQESVPALLVAKTSETLAMTLFLLIGIVVAWVTNVVGSRLLLAMLGLFAVQLVGVGGFVLTQTTGLLGRGGRWLARIGIVTEMAHAEQFDAILRGYYRRSRGRFAVAVGFYLLGWFCTTLEAFVILAMLGVGVSAAAVVVIDTFGSGVRFVTFFIPGSLGTLESAYTAAFEAMGLTAAFALAFSFVRRACQMVWIVVGLIVLVGMRWTHSQAERRRRTRRLQKHGADTHPPAPTPALSAGPPPGGRAGVSRR
jgi:glycosyltransferase 2 family protein